MLFTCNSSPAWEFYFCCSSSATLLRALAPWGYIDLDPRILAPPCSKAVFFTRCWDSQGCIIIRCLALQSSNSVLTTRAEAATAR